MDNSTDAVNILLRAAQSPHLQPHQNNTSYPHSAWNQCWLVRKKWMRAEDVAWYVDDYFSDPKNHGLLVVHEPILCYTILTISSMFHSLPLESNSLGSDLIHVKCWGIVKSLCNRVFWAEEHGSASKLRTYGTVLALLLLVEWPPIIPNLPQDDMSELVVDEVLSTSTNNATDVNFEDLERHIQIGDGITSPLSSSFWVPSLH
ncbi:hypothetical protein N7456_010813 [Penicillium angulare]|uniref:Uncharacterized protein n=1 Tax=Penicillium angulare TaxID=116970 RepID=A0A9W9K039_9EURO|nr:hypothetical protein N7456_010813 [Penicillium angulare]